MISLCVKLVNYTFVLLSFFYKILTISSFAPILSVILYAHLTDLFIEMKYDNNFNYLLIFHTVYFHHLCKCYFPYFCITFVILNCFTVYRL